MTFYTIPTVILFAMLSATVFMLMTEFYRMASPDWINRKKVIRKIENMITQETDMLKNADVYPSVKQQAMDRVGVLIYIKEVVKYL